MDLFYHSINVLLGTFKDVLPIIGVIMFFQLVVIRTRIDNPGRLVYGFLLVFIGLAIFMIGLEEGLFPLGEAMSRQLTDFHFLAKGDASLLEEIERPVLFILHSISGHIYLDSLSVFLLLLRSLH